MTPQESIVARFSISKLERLNAIEGHDLILKGICSHQIT